MTNCPNCGHPFKNKKCEYCGTEKSIKIRSNLNITADGIHMSVIQEDDDKEDGEVQ